MPDITLITSVLNGAPHIARALDSVGNSPLGRIEHLVIDAGSTDGTLEILRRQSGIRTLIRPGMPLYEAWNLAIAEARGEVIGFLNADDELAPNALAAVRSAFESSPETDILCGEAVADPSDDELNQEPRQNSFRYQGPQTAGPNLHSFVFGAPIINAKFFRRNLFDRVGMFDTSFTLAADRDFVLRALLGQHNISWRTIPTLLYRYRIHPGSRTLAASPETRFLIAQEHRRMVEGLLRRNAMDRRSARALRALAAREGCVAAVLRAKTYGAMSALATIARLALDDPAFPIRLIGANASVKTFERSIRQP